MDVTLLIIIIIMGVLLAIALVSTYIVLYNSLLLASENNKRLVSIVCDILASINLETPHLDNLLGVQSPSVDDVISNAEEDSSYFNPHEFDADQYKEENDL